MLTNIHNHRVRVLALTALITENCIDLNKINHFMYNTRARGESTWEVTKPNA